MKLVFASAVALNFVERATLARLAAAQLDCTSVCWLGAQRLAVHFVAPPNARKRALVVRKLRKLRDSVLTNAIATLGEDEVVNAAR